VGSSSKQKYLLDHDDDTSLILVFFVLFDFSPKNSHMNDMAKTKDWPRKPRSTSSWHHLSASEADNGERWSIIWDVQRKPGPDGRNTALERLESGALERARHILRMGFVVYEIRKPSGSVYLEEADLRERLGLQAAMVTMDSPAT
jgi:hypothetical protein